jgi:phospholipase/carboxylesterase
MLGTFEVDARGETRGAVIWMHGLGASNHDFEDIVPMLGRPDLRFIFPAAPVRPVTINGGFPMPSWYDILSFDNPPLREHEPDVRASAEQIVALIDRQVALGVDSRRIVLAGFSQGGAIALHVGLRYQKPLAGILVLSGYLVLPQQLKQERHAANTSTPVLFCHGTVDPTVPLQLARTAFQSVTALQQPAEFLEFNMPHTICEPEITAITRWLGELSFNPAYVYKILTREQWGSALASGFVEPSADDIRDGFIHLSTAAQLASSLAKHFPGQNNLVVLKIRTSDFSDRLRFEQSRNGQLFPHLYGKLPVSAVLESDPIGATTTPQSPTSSSQ